MWRQSINRALTSATGYQLQRAGREPSATTREQAARRELRRTRAQLDEVTRQLERARRRARKARPGRTMPRYYDDAAADVLRRVEARTMTDYTKLFGLVEATRHVARHDIPGDVVECGVWRGGSMQAVALTLLEQGATERHLHLFDTFEGMPPPTEKDRRRDVTAAEMLAASDRSERVWAVAGLDDVEEAMREVGYPAERVHYHRGMVEDTVPERAPERISLLRLDTDWYESTRHELEELYPRLSPGGVLIIDDYGDWEGARQATEEYVARLAEPLLLMPLGSGRIAVKPG